jgi:superfamily II DNA or RNA helicase
MQINLRDYQQLGNDALRKHLKKGQTSTCMVSPTGSGKTVMIADLLMDKRPQMLLTHRRILLEQTSQVLTDFGIDHGLRAAGHGTNFKAPIQLALVNTEYLKTHKSKKWPRHNPEILHIDERHAMTGDMTRTVELNYMAKGASSVGWTATPNELGGICDHLIQVVTVPELISTGHLMQPVVFGPDMPDMKKVEKVKRQSNGDFSRAGMAKVWHPAMIFGRVLTHYRAVQRDGCGTILFAQGVKESLWFAERLSGQGVKAAHIDGDNVWVDGEFHKSDAAKRAEVFARVDSGEIKVLCNRFVLREGFNLPKIGHCILACVFGSRSSYVQSVGRVLRPYPGRSNAVIADHGGNWLLHPAIDSGAPWEMKESQRVLAQDRVEKIRTKRVQEPIACPKCHCIRATGDTCPHCGHRTTKKSRLVVQVDGTLRLVSGAAFPQRVVRRQPDDADVWKRVYFGALRHHPDHTFQQIYSYYALKNNWRWLPRDLPLMPQRSRHWFRRVGEIKKHELI